MNGPKYRNKQCAIRIQVDILLIEISPVIESEANNKIASWFKHCMASHKTPNLGQNKPTADIHLKKLLESFIRLDMKTISDLLMIFNIL